MAPADDPLADLSAEEQRALVELAQARVDGRVNRRDVLAGGAGMAVGAAGLASLTGGGSAQPTGDEGSVGTQSNRVEAWISEADALSVDTGSLNNTVAVKTESDLTGLSAGQNGYIPPETAVNISSRWQPPDDVTLNIYGTLRQADGADLNATMIQARQVQNMTVRVFGTIDGNQANQTASESRLVGFFNDGTTEPKHNTITGTGEIVGMQGNNVVQDNGGKSNYFGGVTVKGWVPNDLSNNFVGSASGNDDSENFTVEGVTFEGSTFGGTAGDGDCAIFTGPGSVVRHCEFFDVPRRAIQGPEVAHGNRIVNPASPGGGGDAIAGCQIVTENVLIGTFDSSGDNGIILFGDTVCKDNYVEGFSNNGIGFDNGTGNAQLFIVSGNWLVDNNQDGTSGNGNLKLTATNSTGGFIVKENICYGNNHDPLNNIIVSSSVSNGRVTENVATGATTEIDDQSGSSVTVANNITI